MYIKKIENSMTQTRTYDAILMRFRSTFDAFFIHKIYQHQANERNMYVNSSLLVIYRIGELTSFGDSACVKVSVRKGTFV